MLLLMRVTLSCIDDQSVNRTFITYENIRLLTMLFETDPRCRRLLWSSVHKELKEERITVDDHLIVPHENSSVPHDVL